MEIRDNLQYWKREYCDAKVRESHERAKTDETIGLCASLYAMPFVIGVFTALFGSALILGTLQDSRDISNRDYNNLPAQIRQYDKNTKNAGSEYLNSRGN